MNLPKMETGELLELKYAVDSELAKRKAEVEAELKAKKEELEMFEAVDGLPFEAAAQAKEKPRKRRRRRSKAQQQAPTQAETAAEEAPAKAEALKPKERDAYDMITMAGEDGISAAKLIHKLKICTQSAGGVLRRLRNRGLVRYDSTSKLWYLV